MKSCDVDVEGNPSKEPLNKINDILSKIPEIILGEMQIFLKLLQIKQG